MNRRDDRDRDDRGRNRQSRDERDDARRSPRGAHSNDDYEMARQRTGGREDERGRTGGARSIEDYHPSWNWEGREPSRHYDEHNYQGRDAQGRDTYGGSYRGGQYGYTNPNRPGGGSYAAGSYREPYQDARERDYRERFAQEDRERHARTHEEHDRYARADRFARSDEREHEREREHEHGHDRPGLFQRIKELVGKGPKNYRRSDERILEDVADRLSQGYLDASDIDVVVKDGEVTLEGSVRSKRDVRLAEDLIEHVHGVKDIDNRLKAQRPSDDATRSEVPSTVRGENRNTTASSRRGNA